MILGNLTLPKMDGLEGCPGVYLIGEPTPVKGTTLLRSLANVHGALCLVELSIKFTPDTSGNMEGPGNEHDT